MIGISVQIIIAGLALVGPVFGASHPEIHLQMTPEERLKIFQTAGTDVPPYEVVEIKSSRIQKRDAQSGHHIHIRAFGEDIEHYLTPIDDVLMTNRTRIQTIRCNSVDYNINFTVTDVPLPMKMIMDYIYEKKSLGITLYINQHKGRREVRGVIGYQNLKIRPLSDLNREFRFPTSADDKLADKDKSYHIIYKIPNTDGQNSTNPLFRIKRSYPTIRKKQNSYHKIAYPEILVIVDYDLFELMNFDMFETITYVVAFWNSVDMLYRDLDDPQIRINIATIAIAQDKCALSYLKPANIFDGVDGNKTLHRKGRWLYRYGDDKKFPISSYDAAITMMGRYSLGKIVDGSFREETAEGNAFTKSVCEYFPLRKKVTKLGIFNSSGNYRAVLTAVQILANILGVLYDGEGNSCNPAKNELMTRPVTPFNISRKYELKFSNCSKTQFKEFLNLNASSCVWNNPNVGRTKSLVRVLPGRITYIEQQCTAKLGYVFPVISETMCRTLVCRNWRNDTHSDGRPAADGTYCAENKICLHGYCVDAIQVLKYHGIETTFDPESL